MSRSKTLTVGLILVLAGLAVAAWCMFGNAAGGIGLTYENEKMYSVGDAKISGPVEKLDLDWTEGFVNIAYHEGSEVLLSETSPKALKEDDRFRWWLDGKTLRIRYAKSGVRLSVTSLEKTLTVSLPEGMALTGADLSVTSADMRIDSLVAEELTLSSTSGNITASAVTKNLKASSTSGDMALTLPHGADTVALDSTSGNISCTLDYAVKVTAGSTSGGIGLTLATGAETIRTHSTSGNTYIDSASVKDADLSSTSGSITARLAALEKLKIGSTSGSVTAKLPAEPGFTCTVHTASGSLSSALELAKDGNRYSCGNGSSDISIDTTSGGIRIEPYTP